MTTLKRIHLLSEAEIADVYARPDFNAQEQALYFTLDDRERDCLNHYATPLTRLYFILQLGYFKAKQQFFNVGVEEVPADVEYIFSHLVDAPQATLSGRPSSCTGGISRRRRL
jgi:hypothetical protein